MALVGLVPLWGAMWGMTRGWLATDPEFAFGFSMMIVFGLGLLGFPLLFLWSVLRGLPLLHVDEGVVHQTSIFGRVQILRLTDYAEVSLGEAVLAKGYQPRLEAVPLKAGDKPRMLQLRPFVHNRAEAEALVALIRHAAGDRPKLSPAQAALLQSQTAKEWKILWAISIGAFILLILLNLKG